MLTVTAEQAAEAIRKRLAQAREITKAEWIDRWQWQFWSGYAVALETALHDLQLIETPLPDLDALGLHETGQL